MRASWRWRFVDAFSPAVHGMTFGAWLSLLRNEHFSVDAPYWLRAVATTCQSALNTPMALWETKRYDAILQDLEVPPPVFIIGHWRSGTTHLHNLLCQDERFAYPNLFQAMNPLTFLCTEPFMAKLLTRFTPKQRHLDNVAQALDVPAEDELIAWHASTLTPYMSYNFPRTGSHYDRYLTFREASEHEREQWRSSLMRFLQKLTWKYNRPLVLKSPPHTCRLKYLLEMFPGAKFMHIHRHPYRVFLSTRQAAQRSIDMASFQRADPEALEDRIIQQYAEMYDVFFEERHAIPEGQFAEVAFEALEHDPINHLQRLYLELDLPDFTVAQPAFESYLKALSTYQKNDYPDIAPHLRMRLQKAWAQTFEAWGYTS